MLVSVHRPTGIPQGTVNVRQKRAWNPGWSGEASSISEVVHHLLFIIACDDALVDRAVAVCALQVTSIQLEWEKLSQLTGDPKWAAMTRRAMLAIRSIEPPDGLYPMFVHPGRGGLSHARTTKYFLRDSFYFILFYFF